MRSNDYKAPNGYTPSGAISEKTFMHIRSDASKAAPKYMASDLKELRSRYAPGRKFSMLIGEDERRSRRRYTVEKRYPYHVSCVDRNGIHESFNYFQLATEAKAIQ